MHPHSIVAEGLHFPEGPIAMDDGSVILVEIKAGRLSRLAPDGAMTTGMRSWMGRNRSLAAVVMIVHVRNGSASSGPSGSRHRSHRPPKTIGASSERWMNQACLPPPSNFSHS